MKEPSKAKSKEPQNEISYQDAVNELELILSEIETGETDVDILSEKVKRALFLISYCRAKLRSTDEQVRKILKSFESDEN